MLHKHREEGVMETRQRNLAGRCGHEPKNASNHGKLEEAYERQELALPEIFREDGLAHEFHDKEYQRQDQPAD